MKSGADKEVCEVECATDLVIELGEAGHLVEEAEDGGDVGHRKWGGRDERGDGQYRKAFTPSTTRISSLITLGSVE